MALVRVCDRCGEDDNTVIEHLISVPTELVSALPHKRVDLCGECRDNLLKFLDGELTIESEEETEPSESKKEQDGPIDYNPPPRTPPSSGDNDF